jgi:hypothetical protein
VSAGTETLERFPALLKTYPDIRYVHYAFGPSLVKAGRDKAERNSDPSPPHQN